MPAREPAIRLARSLRSVRDAVTAETRVAALKLLSRRPYDIGETIVVSGSPRSGTTWLGNVLAAIPGSSILFEPLHLERVPEARRAGFGWRTYVPPHTAWPEGKRFLDDVLSGRVLNAWTTREIGIPRRTTTWIVKFVRANRMLGWIAEQFPIRAPVLLLRHPCAVVASQLRHPGWANPEKPGEDAFLVDHPSFRPVLDALETSEEFLAAGWAMDTFAPLSLPAPHPWHLAVYERLVRDPLREVTSIFDRWSAPVPSGIWKRVERKSSTTAGPSRGVSDVTSVWTKTLTPAQIKRVLDVAAAFGLDFYGEDDQPDGERLQRFFEA